MSLKDAVVMITGASRGIGKMLVAEALAGGAAKVYAVGRSEAVKGLFALEARVVTLSADVSQPGEAERLAEIAKDVTWLLNNAGVIDFGDVLTTPVETFERNLGTNFFGKLRMAQAFAPVIERNGGGGIVNTLTLVALASMPGLAAYNASKAAAWSMTLSLRASLLGRGIRVVSVFPGPVDTDMLAGVEMPKTSPTDVARAIVTGIKQGAEDIFPDPMSLSIYPAWRADHKAVEAQFAAM